MADKLKMNRRRFLATAGAAASATAMQITLPGSAFAQAGYPARPITVVVMYAAGGGTDTIMRKLAEEMAKAQGWKINVINKPGAVGGVATQFVNAAKSDGYTLLGGANYNRFVRVLGHAEFTPWKDWVPMKAANALASWSVRKDSPFQNFGDMIAAAKANPGSVSISTSGTGGVWHELPIWQVLNSNMFLTRVANPQHLLAYKVKLISPVAVCMNISSLSEQVNFAIFVRRVQKISCSTMALLCLR